MPLDAPVTDQPVSVFLSYSRQDQPKALPIVRVLEDAGCTVWWDGLLEGGAAFANQTETALESADAVVVVWSKTSIKSHWVLDEATRGRERAKLVPVTIDGTEAPLGFRQHQLLSLTKWNGRADTPEGTALLRAVMIAGGRPDAPPRPPSFATQNPSRRQLMLVGGGAALSAVGGLAIWQSGLLGPKSKPNSVAVLPFKNLSNDPEQGYFSDGLSEEIRTALSRNAKLRVMAPASAKAARDEATNPAEIAGKLGVAFLLRGSVRASGEVLRITAELINGKTGIADWQDRFDRPRGDVFAVQGEIADAVAAALSAQVASIGQASSKRKDSGPGGTSSVKAYDAYLRGNAYYELRSGEAAYRAALAQYDDAIAADARFAQAHAARARVVTVITNAYGKASEFRAQYDDAIASARKAVSIAPDLAIAQSTLGFVLVQGKLDLRGARAPYERARRLGVGDATVQMLYAAYSAEMGDAEAAKAAAARAVELDPLNAAAFRMQAFVHYCARRYEEAIAACTQSISLNPKIALSHAYRGDALMQLGKASEARRDYGAEPASLWRLSGLAIANRRLGEIAWAERAMTELVAEMGDGSAYQQGQILTQWGDLSGAMTKLNLARSIGDVGLAQAKIDPFLDPLRKEPSFLILLNMLGFD